MKRPYTRMVYLLFPGLLPLTWDYTCVNFTAKSNHLLTAIENAEILKNKYASLINTVFIPIVINTLGMFRNKALNFIKTLRKIMRQITGYPRNIPPSSADFS
ncbi:unnamed protein product [Gordionus sp. m RMFG-2023]